MKYSICIVASLQRENTYIRSSEVGGRQTSMAPFLRIAFNAFDLGALPSSAEHPFCAIKMKESMSTGLSDSYGHTRAT
ncbi:hypothetical protein GJAV_G00173870 [Gymnothorax javanicus]|nr:hypothetical protein GJAV_G00173870 [Gymnothorax javanicus]